MRPALTMLIFCMVLGSCGDPAPTGEHSADSAPSSLDGAGQTTGGGSEATGRLRVANRYPFDNRDLPVFPSPDGRMYLDVDGCVVPIAEDSRPACPEGDRWVASASWAPDGSFVVHDRNAFTGGGDSDIHVVFIDDPTGDETGRAPRAQFANLTEDGAGGGSNIDVMPLVVAGEVRFLRLSSRAETPVEFEMVTIGLDGAVTGSAPTTLLATADLANPRRAVLVADRHVLLGIPSAGNQGQLITIDADGTTLIHPIDDQSVVRFYATGAGDAVVMTFNTELDSTGGQIRTFDGSSHGTTGLAVTERGFDVVSTIGFDPAAVAFAPDRSEIVAAYSNADGATTTLRVWNDADATITDIGTIPVRSVHEMRWVSSDELVVFGEEEILTLEVTT